jgi:hypothetical protein
VFVVTILPGIEAGKRIGVNVFSEGTKRGVAAWVEGGAANLSAGRVRWRYFGLKRSINLPIPECRGKRAGGPSHPYLRKRM